MVAEQRISKLLGHHPSQKFESLRQNWCTLQENGQWQPFKSRGGHLVERHLGEPNHPPYLRTRTLISGPVATVAAYVMLDKDAHATWDPTLDRVHTLAQFQNHAVYQIPCFTGATPWVPNREFVYYEGYEQKEEAILALAQSIIAPDVPLLLKKYIRGSLAFIAREAKQIDSETTQLTTIWQVDMAGRLPKAWTAAGSAKTLCREATHFQAHFREAYG